MNNFKTLIFDFDGTIADSFPVIWKIADTLLVENKRPKLTQKQRKTLKNMSPREIIKEFQIPMIKLPFLLAKGINLINKEIKNINPIAGIGAVLKKLQQKDLVLGLLSSNSLTNLQLFLENQQLEVFDFIASENNLFGKNRALKKILRQHNLKIEETIYFGDEVRDVEACKKIGLKIAAVTWGFNTKNKLNAMQPDYLIEKVKEILEII